jgi:HEAT repeat protein
LGGRSLVPVLVDALRATDDIDVQVHIVEVLETLEPCRELQNVLLRLLHHVASRVRQRAMGALAEMGDKEAIYYLNEIAREVEQEPAGLLGPTDVQAALKAVQQIEQRMSRGYSLEAK